MLIYASPRLAFFFWLDQGRSSSMDDREWIAIFICFSPRIRGAFKSNLFSDGLVPHFKSAYISAREAEGPACLEV